jgi:hypothetical protein
MQEAAIAVGNIGHRAGPSRDGKAPTGLERNLSLAPSSPFSLGHSGFHAADWSVTAPAPMHSPPTESLQAETGHVQARSTQTYRLQATEYMTPAVERDASLYNKIMAVRKMRLWEAFRGMMLQSQILFRS